jgi:heptaprenylglyceryl phosphate synthase
MGAINTREISFKAIAAGADVVMLGNLLAGTMKARRNHNTARPQL